MTSAKPSEGASPLVETYCTLAFPDRRIGTGVRIKLLIPIVIFCGSGGMAGLSDVGDRVTVMAS
jgi:hypothetical protein